MSKRCRRACLALALGLAVAAPPTARAQAPAGDEFIMPGPLDTITPCLFMARQQAQKPAKEQPGRLVIGLGVQTGSGVLVHIQKLDAGQSRPSVGLTLPVMGLPFGISPVAHVVPTVNCPYLQQPAPARPVPQTLDANGVLANLEKLTKARELYRMAEYYQRVGRRETAALYYQEAHLACPNCRYGMLAMRQLSRLDAERAEAAAEEQETPDVVRTNWHDAARALGCCADLACGAATRFLCEVPVGAVRLRVEYRSPGDGSPAMTIRVPGFGTDR